ncbi:MAG: transketolase [Caldilineaceae bacterium]|nr:transketolase [Caldilineaceae bacterium]
MSLMREAPVAAGEQAPMVRRTLPELQQIAWRLSRQILEMTTQAGSGHPSSSLSAIDLLTGLYFGGMLRYTVQEPDWPRRDRFIMSKGHAAPALYAILAEAGYFPAAQLSSLRQLGSPLEGHPNRRRLAGVEASTGSLGQGLSIGLGHALGARLAGLDYRVYVLLGDGEADEGQIWEAAMAAAKYKAANLTAILDYNQYQQTGSVTKVMPSLEPLVDKWEAFGWRVFEIDGHDMAAVVETLWAVRDVIDQPQVIIAHTLKGRGLSPFQANEVNRKHGEVLKADELAVALAELAEQKVWDRYQALADELSVPANVRGLHP